jgi:hypothetical protein
MESEKSYQFRPLYWSEYAVGAKEAIYLGKEEENSGETRQGPTNILMDHHKYREKDFEFKDPRLPLDRTFFYAFGLIINLFHTRLLVIDFDLVDFHRYVSPVYDKLKHCKEVKEINVLETSRCAVRKKFGNYHMAIGFDKFYDVRGLPGFFPKSCSGHAAFCTNRREQTIRVSQKFPYSPMIDTRILPIISWNSDLNEEIKCFHTEPDKKALTKKLNLRTSL